MADSVEAVHTRLIEAAKRLQARGFFEHSSCADLAVNRDMCAMRLALVQLSGAAAPVGVEVKSSGFAKMLDAYARAGSACALDPNDAAELAAELRAAAEILHLAQQPAAVDEAMVERALGAYSSGPWVERRERMRKALTAALAGQQQGGTP